MLACEGKFIPEIVQLLDWQVYLDHYVMVLEYPSPCMDLLDFTTSKGGKLNKDLAKDIMWQATMAAYMCCRQGFFHRNIKMENLLITSNSLTLGAAIYLKVRLTRRLWVCFIISDTSFTFVWIRWWHSDSVLGSLLEATNTVETVNLFSSGTRDYTCPEFLKTGEYYGKPETVYSLGALLFAMLCGKFPNCNDRYSINERIWYMDGLSEGEIFIRPTVVLNDRKQNKWFDKRIE